MSKIKNKESKIPNPYEAVSHKTEWTCAAKIAEWINEIARDNNISIGQAEVENISVKTKKRADILIYESKGSEKILSVIECKQPFWDVYADELKQDALNKAFQWKTKYFATCNFRELIWWKTQESSNPTLTEAEQIVEKYKLSEIYDIDNIEHSRFREPIRKSLKEFIIRLYNIYYGKEPEPKHPIDEFLIFRLHEKIRVLSNFYIEIIEDKCHKDQKFAKDLQLWFHEQSWDFLWQTHDFGKAARQTAYLLVNKIIFYDLLQAKRPNELDPLDIPKDLTKGSLLQTILQGYFQQVLKIDYQTIYTTDFIDSIAFPDNAVLVDQIKELITFLKKYDFSSLGFDIIGRLFERLIPREERHNLGQYFTNADVIDLILKFCHRHEDDKVLDPSCGAGTFLVRAYQHKKLMNQSKGHEEILQKIWGNDIAKFPAHLATINLAIKDLSVDRNYPNILKEDFFALHVGDEGWDLPDNYRQRLASSLGGQERTITYPRWFDAIVGNPPYTRQEEIPEIGVNKLKLIDAALLYHNRPLANISKRAGIYAYFFVHAFKFLREGKYLGLIVSNSWMDVDYGKGLQEFFLRYFKIVAILESKVERWFDEADVNTSIIILQKCKDEKEKNENLVRFVYIKKPLKELFGITTENWDDEINRLKKIESFRKTILGHSELYENDDFRIYPKQQKELWIEGFDEEENKYAGAKWGKYLRAPDIFFRILEKGKNIFVPLKSIAKVRFGIKTGANEFFYLTEEEIKQKGIEKEFWMHKSKKGKWIPNYVIKSPRESNAFYLKTNSSKYRVLNINKEKSKLKGTNVLEYIKHGESLGFQNRETCNKRNLWYNLNLIKPAPILFGMIHAYRHIIFYNEENNIYADHNLFEILPYNSSYTKYVCASLFYTFSILAKEILGRTYGGGSGPVKTEGIDIKQIPILNPAILSKKILTKIDNAFDNLKNHPILEIFEEFNSASDDKFYIDKINLERRKLDKIFLEDILNLSREEQEELYFNVLESVSSRKERAQSTGDQKKIKEGIDIVGFVDNIIEKIGENILGKFYKEQILSLPILKTVTLPQNATDIKVQNSLLGWQLFYGKNYIECKSESEAEYLKIFLEAGFEEVKIPKEEKKIKLLLSELKPLKENIDEVLSTYLNSIINNKIKEQIKHLVWQRINEM